MPGFDFEHMLRYLAFFLPHNLGHFRTRAQGGSALCSLVAKALLRGTLRISLSEGSVLAGPADRRQDPGK